MVVVGLEGVVCVVVGTRARTQRLRLTTLVSYMPLADFLSADVHLRADVSPLHRRITAFNYGHVLPQAEESAAQGRP